MNINKGLLIGIVAGVIVSSVLVYSTEFTPVDAQMGDMMGGGSSGGGMSHGGDSSSSSSGMMMGGGPSRHGIWYGPGTVHQQCQMGGDMPPRYCEPYYKAISSVVGVKISKVEPVNEKTLQVTLKEIGIGGNGINENISVSIGAGDLVGTGIVNAGWSGTTTIDVPVKGIGHIYNHKSMHVHIFPVTG